MAYCYRHWLGFRRCIRGRPGNLTYLNIYIIPFLLLTRSFLFKEIVPPSICSWCHHRKAKAISKMIRKSHLIDAANLMPKYLINLEINFISQLHYPFFIALPVWKATMLYGALVVLMSHGQWHVFDTLPFDKAVISYSNSYHYEWWVWVYNT